MTIDKQMQSLMIKRVDQYETSLKVLSVKLQMGKKRKRRQGKKGKMTEGSIKWITDKEE